MFWLGAALFEFVCLVGLLTIFLPVVVIGLLRDVRRRRTYLDVLSREDLSP
jgi:hypothetical protein